jgi:uncharacterized RDD family membrane protein YckC
MEKAGFFTRFIALLLDVFLMGILAWLIMFVLGGFIGLTSGTGSTFLDIIAGGTAILLIILILFFQFFYFGYFWSKNGKSLGMKLVNIKVVRQTEGEGLSFFRAGLRGTIGYWLSGLVFGLGFLWAAFDGNKETWHDKIFGTWVVKD